MNYFVLFYLAGLLLLSACADQELYPEQVQYAPTENAESRVVIEPGSEIEEIEYAVNSKEHFKWSLTFDEDEPTPIEFRWFGIDGIKSGDTLHLKCWVKNGDTVRNFVAIDFKSNEQIKIKVENDGTASISNLADSNTSRVISRKKFEIGTEEILLNAFTLQPGEKRYEEIPSNDPLMISFKTGVTSKRAARYAAIPEPIKLKAVDGFTYVCNATGAGALFTPKNAYDQS